MLHQMSWEQFVSWKAFDRIEPIGGKRLDYLFASMVSMMANLHRNTEKFPDPFPLSMFLLKWDETKKKLEVVEAPKPKQKSWQELKAIGMFCAAAFNAIEESDRERREKRKKKVA